MATVAEMLVSDAMNCSPEDMFDVAFQHPELIPNPSSLAEVNTDLWFKVNRIVNQLETYASFAKEFVC